MYHAFRGSSLTNGVGYSSALVVAVRPFITLVGGRQGGGGAVANDLGSGRKR